MSLRFLQIFSTSLTSLLSSDYHRNPRYLPQSVFLAMFFIMQSHPHIATSNLVVSRNNTYSLLSEFPFHFYAYSVIHSTACNDNASFLIGTALYPNMIKMRYRKGNDNIDRLDMSIAHHSDWDIYLSELTTIGSILSP